MKKIFYFLIALSFTACTSKNVDKGQEFSTTPNGVADLQPNSVPSSNSNVQSNLLVNPEHGLPGHDCSIAVGAPLKKSSGNTPNENTATNGNSKSEAAQIVKPENTAKPVAEGNLPKINPAHGQPNHRCEIAVGAPLT